jgi:putative phage-type endonuclease
LASTTTLESERKASMQTKSLFDLYAEEAEERLQWMESRKEGVGASESAGVLGVSPWSSPLSVYVDKTIDAPSKVTEAQIERWRWGHILERVILDELSSRTGLTFRRAPQNRITRHKKWPNVPMFATPDAYILEEARRLCQIKTTNQFGEDEWKDGVPLHVNVQVQHEMSACEREAEIVVVLVGGQKLVWYEIERHETFISQLEPEVTRFWYENVIPRVFPPADGSTATANALERLHPADSGVEIMLDDRAVQLDEELSDLKSDLKKLEKRKKEIENEIKSMIGPATWGKLPNGAGRFSWKTIERKAYQAKAATFRQLRRGK